MKKFKIGDKVAVAGCPVYLIITEIDSNDNYHFKKDLDDDKEIVMTPLELARAYV